MSIVRYQKLSLSQAVNHKNAKRYFWGRLYSKALVKGRLFVSDMALAEDTVFNLNVLCSESNLKLFKTDIAL